ncbi:hypothetical protein KIPB_016144, partial [Kipferlia bialata]
STILILCVDLGTDIIPAIAFSFENMESDIMSRPPRKQTDRLVDWRLIVFAYAQIGVFQAVACFASFIYVLYDAGLDLSEVLFFNRSHEGITDELFRQAQTACFWAIIPFLSLSLSLSLSLCVCVCVC